MSAVLLGVGAWIVVTGLLCCLGRAAALSDRGLEAAATTSEAFYDRREGSDRRASGRAWAAESPGRRREDALERELANARLALEQAEARVQRAEARHRVA